MKEKRERPMKKGKLIQPPRLLPILKLSSASFEDASSLPSMLHFTLCAVLQTGCVPFIGNLDFHLIVNLDVFSLVKPLSKTWRISNFLLKRTKNLSMQNYRSD